MARTQRLQQQLADLQYGQHVCFFYEQPAEALEVASLFIARGLATGGACLYTTGENSPDRVLAALASAGVDVSREQERGALTLLPAYDVVFPPGQFEPDSILTLCEEMVEQAVTRGFNGLWLVSDMTLAFVMNVTLDQALQWEAGVHHIFETRGLVAICQYERHRFATSSLVDALHRHPIALVNDELCHNLFYEPPELFLDSGRVESRLDWMLDEVERAHAAEMELRARIQQLATVANEREEIAMDLHDDLVQSLYALTLELATLSRSAEAQTPELTQGLRHAEDYLREISGRVRTFIRELRFPEQRETDLRAGLERIVRDIRAGPGLEANLQWPTSLAPSFPGTIVADLLAIAREATSNAIRHAGPTSVTIVVSHAAGVLGLTIRDNGRGFVPDRVSQPQGEGLSNMAERAARIGGELVVSSDLGQGTEVRVTILVPDGR